MLTSSDIIELKKETKCFYCGCELNDSNRTLDHFIPLCRGGTNIKENVVVVVSAVIQRREQKLMKSLLDFLNKTTYSVF